MYAISVHFTVGHSIPTSAAVVKVVLYPGHIEIFTETGPIGTESGGDERTTGVVTEPPHGFRNIAYKISCVGVKWEWHVCVADVAQC